MIICQIHNNKPPISFASTESILHLAIKNKDEQVVKFALEKGMNPNTKANLIVGGKTVCDVTPLHSCAYYAANDLMKVLIEYGADIQSNCYEVIQHDNATFGQIGNEVTLQNITPLHLASYTSNLEAMKTLLSHGASNSSCIMIDNKNILAKGNMLHMAALSGNIEIVEYIIHERLFL